MVLTQTISPVTSASTPPFRKIASSKVRLELPIRATRTDIQFPVEPDRRLVFDDRFDDVEILARLLGVGILIVAECPKILGDGGVEISQIVRVEDDALAVDLGIAHPERVKEPELFA